MSNKKIVYWFILTLCFFVSGIVCRETYAQMMLSIESDGSSKLFVVKVPAGTAITMVPQGDATTKCVKGSYIVLKKPTGVYTKKIEEDTTVGELSKQTGVPIEDIINENFFYMKPEPSKIVCSDLIIKINETETISIPFINAEWDSELGGIVAHWGGGEDRWFTAYCAKQAKSSTSKNLKKDSNSTESLHNLVLIKAQPNKNGGIIDVNVSWKSPNNGLQRRIGYIIDISNNTIKPTLGLSGTKYEQ